MNNNITTVAYKLDSEEVAPLVEFFLLVKARPVSLAALYQYMAAIPGVTPATLLEFLTSNEAAANGFISDSRGNWGLMEWQTSKAA
jgi:hypothetical protein